MISQLRIYTINPGMMDSYTKMFKEKISPIHKKHGMPVERAWINEEGSEFVWVRTFANEAEMEEKLRAAGRELTFEALGDEPGRHIAKMDVRVLATVDLG